MTENQFDTVIEPQRDWLSVNLREIWKYRELVYILAWRDVKIRYKQTVLGAAWAIFQPFVSMIVFSVFFGTLVKVPSDNLPYPIFVYAGLLPWTFFANSLTGASNSLIGQANLISKVYFPRLIILDFAIALLIMFAMMLYYGFLPTISLSIFPFLLVATIATALGVGTLFSALSVAYRDVKYIVPFLVQLWMYATPIIYPASIVPERWRWVLSFNPMAGLIDGYRSSLLGKPFDWLNISISLMVSFGFLALGLIYFKKVELRFADII
jgi:lipopolysaccharide transport system permease protein